MAAIAPRPDMAFLIDIEPTMAVGRISESRGDIPNEFEKVESLEQVRRIFRSLAKEDASIREIDGRMPIDAVFATIAGLLVEGPLKAKRCAKGYDCDIFYCTPRILGECEWFKTQGRLGGSKLTTLPALLK
jgi:hypothetical protein